MDVLQVDGQQMVDAEIWRKCSRCISYMTFVMWTDMFAIYTYQIIFKDYYNEIGIDFCQPKSNGFPMLTPSC